MHQFAKSLAAAESSTPPSSSPPRRITKLHVFDFDSTLFRSPLPNADLWSDNLLGALISDCGWFQESRTLRHPYIPETPDATWWHAETVAKVEECLEAGRRSDTVTVLLTGRRRDRFGERIERMCRDRGLTFDLFFFREGTDPTLAPLYHATTLDFKLAVLQTLLNHVPAVNHVELYDDRKRHLDLFAGRLQSFCDAKTIRTYAVHYVKHAECDALFMPPDLETSLVEDLVDVCNGRIVAAKQREEHARMARSVRDLGPVDKDGIEEEEEREGEEESSDDPEARLAPMCRLKRRTSASLFRDMLELTDQVRYTAVVLDDPSHALLVERFPSPAPGWALRCHHVTLCMGPARPDVLRATPVGSRASLRVVDFGELVDTVQAVRVEPVDPVVLHSDNDVPHVTLHVAPDGRAHRSNAIVDWVPLTDPFTIAGTVTEKHVTGLRVEKGPSQMKKHDVSLGDLVLKHHGAALQGRQIGFVVQHVEEWMAKTFIENLGQNAANIEFHIQGLDVGEICRKAEEGGPLRKKSQGGSHSHQMTKA
ncbi:hypothetical protein HKX48_006988 [Thoreauomyces humboldtii]|nr:hypothetical protein HKX48_006988 [Thoreauomyces humboldtii]